MTHYACTCTPDSPYDCLHCQSEQDQEWEWWVEANDTREPSYGIYMSACGEDGDTRAFFEQRGPQT